MMDEKRLVIVIVTMNSAGDILPCLESVAQDPCPPFEKSIVVVDNCSHDRTVELVRRHWPEVHLLENDRSQSLSLNNNRGMRAMKGDYYLILNPDTRLQKGCLARMLHFMEESGRAGMCAPKLVNPDGSLQLSARRFPTPLAVAARATPLKRLRPFAEALAAYMMADWRREDRRTVDWALGACLMIRQETLEDIGLMDEGYRLYYEDIDWCYRAWQCGWSVHYLADAVVVHAYQRRSAHSLNRLTMWHIQSILRFFWKFRLNTG